MGNHTIQTIFLTAVCLLLAALPSRGQEEEESRLELGVQLLGHGEVRNGGFNESMAEEEADDNSHAGFMMSRTRVTADFLQKGLSARVTAQHAGVWGQKGQGSLNLNEAWARLSLKNGLFAQLGRQALSYDDERIIGPNDWAMAYMTHDVLKLGYEGNGHRLHAILAYNQNAENTYGGTYYADGAQPYKTMQTVWYHYDWKAAHLGASLLLMNIGMQAGEKNEGRGLVLPPVGQKRVGAKDGGLDDQRERTMAGSTGNGADGRIRLPERRQIFRGARTGTDRHGAPRQDQRLQPDLRLAP